MTNMAMMKMLKIGDGGGDDDDVSDNIISGLMRWRQWKWTDETSQWQVF